MSAKDIKRFYYQNKNNPCQRSSLSLDVLIVDFLILRLGSLAKVRKWILAQVKTILISTQDHKSISRMIQENAIRLIADPELIEKLPDDQRIKSVEQVLLSKTIGQNLKAKRPKRHKLINSL